MTIQITRTGQDDLSRARALISACIQHMESEGIHQWDNVYPNSDLIAADIANSTLYVATIDRECCGIIVLNDNQSPEYNSVDWSYEGNRILVVHRLTVLPHWQRKGVASSLMDFAERFADENGYEAIRLDAFTGNPGAVALYERRGYRKAGVVRFRKGLFYCFERETRNQ